MFRLQKVEIWGFKSKTEHIIYEFSASNITVVFGQNGCGKTTLFQILYGVFSKEESMLTDNNVKSIRIWCQEKGETIEFSVNKKETNAENVGSTLYDWSELKTKRLDEISVLFLGVERSYSFSAVSASSSMIYNFLRRNTVGQKLIIDMGTNTVRGLAESLSAYISFNNRIRFNRQEYSGNLFERKHLYLSGREANIESLESLIMKRYERINRIANETIQKALMTTLSQIVGTENTDETEKQSLKSISDYMESNHELISETLKFVQMEKKDILFFLKDSEKKHIIDNCEKNKYNRLLLQNIIHNILPYKNILLSIANLQKMFNAKLGYGKQMKVCEDEIKIFVNSEHDYHGINNLSSGEKQFLTLLACIFIDNTDRNLVLIDEPELSLNIRWQAELINLLMENAPKTQILLATHSPAIVDEHVECLKELQRGGEENNV